MSLVCRECHGTDVRLTQSSLRGKTLVIATCRNCKHYNFVETAKFFDPKLPYQMTRTGHTPKKRPKPFQLRLPLFEC